ncbi:hypothetical protein ACIBG6_01815 [Streptomyces sp. NPDC050842]|uniref:hypothetical protein n=1 Tax=Streptomyces sp. NPDC050842 TaxID=3365636 RepID=UPI00378C81C3
MGGADPTSAERPRFVVQIHDATTDRHDKPIPIATALEHGHASFRLDGRKPRGGYSLTRIRSDRDGERADRRRR